MLKEREEREKQMADFEKDCSVGGGGRKDSLEGRDGATTSSSSSSYHHHTGGGGSHHDLHNGAESVHNTSTGSSGSDPGMVHSPKTGTGLHHHHHDLPRGIDRKPFLDALPGSSGLATKPEPVDSPKSDCMSGVGLGSGGSSGGGLHLGSAAAAANMMGLGLGHHHPHSHNPLHHPHHPHHQSHHPHHQRSSSSLLGGSAGSNTLPLPPTENPLESSVSSFSVENFLPSAHHHHNSMHSGGSGGGGSGNELVSRPSPLVSPQVFPYSSRTSSELHSRSSGGSGGLPGSTAGGGACSSQGTGASATPPYSSYHGHFSSQSVFPSQVRGFFLSS